MKWIFILSFFLSSSVLWAQTSYVAPTRLLLKKGYQIGISGDVFTTSKKVDEDGSNQALVGGEKFSRTQVDLTGYYGLLSNFQIGGGARFVQNSSSVQDPATTELTSDTSSGLQSTFLTLAYAFKPVDRLQYIIEGLYRYTPYTNEESTIDNEGSLVLGDEGDEMSGGLGVTYSSKTNNFLTGRIGYRQPGTDLSSEIYWQIEGALDWKKFALIAGVNGITSLKNDSSGGDPLEKPNYNVGSTNLYNSIDRENIAPYVGANVALGKNWRVEARATQVVSGRSTDLGTGFGASLVRRIEDSKTQSLDQKFKEYDFEGSITKVSPKKEYVLIDKGLSDGVQKGMKIDFFENDYVGGNVLIARGTVVSSKTDSAIVKITHNYNTKKELKAGILARGSFR